MSRAHYDDFKVDLRGINRRFKKRTSSLKGLLEHLKSTRDKPVKFEGVDAAIALCKSSRDARITKYRPAIERLVEVWGTPKSYPKMVASASGDGGSSAAALVKSVRRQLDVMKDYVSGDALSFPRCIHPHKKERIEQEAKDFLKRADARVGGTGAAIVGLGRPVWKPGMLAKSFQAVTTHKAGVCTTFAHTAAHILSHKNADVRIEVVAFRNHVFVIVGRKGGYVRQGSSFTLPKYDTWAGNWWIVDGWAGAMGWEVVYEGTKKYPFVGMMHPLKLVMANDFPEGED